MWRIRSAALSWVIAVAAISTVACERSELENELAEHEGMAVAAASVERGEYLVTVGGCHDCHTPKVMGANGPELDTSRLMAGYPADRPVPAPIGGLTMEGWAAAGTADLTGWLGPWGVSFAANLTPDASGIGNWTEEIFMQALRTGQHAGSGRPILPPMPWQTIGQMTDDDLRSIFMYLNSLPPIVNAVPAPVPPTPPGN